MFTANSTMYILIYVDDILITDISLNHVQVLIQSLKKTIGS